MCLDAVDLMTLFSDLLVLQEKVIGFHVLGPNAGEITQGYAVAMRLGATKADFDATIGIHPTCTEVRGYNEYSWFTVKIYILEN